jgi:hypothetical protein
MSSVPADDGTDRSALPVPRSLDRDILSFRNGDNLSSLRPKRMAKEFILEYSSLGALSGCGTIRLKKQNTHNRCDDIRCYQCAPLRQARTAEDLRRLAEPFTGQLVTMTTSLSTDASTGLTEAWDALDDMTATLHSGRWLSGRFAAYRRHTELTKNDGWHPHNHYVLALPGPLSESQFENLKLETQHRISDLARQAGFTAAPELQHIERVTRTPGRLINYVTKGPMALHGDSRTPGAIFQDAAFRHDPEAAADWLEFESASEGRTWQSTGGGFRTKTTKTATVTWEQLDEVDLPWKSRQPTKRQELAYEAKLRRETAERERDHLRQLEEAGQAPWQLELAARQAHAAELARVAALPRVATAKTSLGLDFSDLLN